MTVWLKEMKFNRLNRKKDKTIFGLTVLVAFSVLYALIGAFTIGIISSGFGQLESLSNASFNNGYILNYSLGLDDEYVFPENSIRLYTSDNTKIVSTCVMKGEGTNYTLTSAFISSIDCDLQYNEVIISKNIAQRYGINIGDILFATVPYKESFEIYTVVDIGNENYDVTDMNLYNSVGVVLLGYNSEYTSSINSKYIVFSNASLAKTISKNPQILDKAFSRSEIIFDIIIQIVPIIVLYISMFFIYFVVLNKKVFSESKKQAIVFLNKGYGKRYAIHSLGIETMLYLFAPLCVLPLWMVSYNFNILVALFFNIAIIGCFLVYRIFAIKAFLQRRRHYESVSA